MMSKQSLCVGGVKASGAKVTSGMCWLSIATASLLLCAVVPAAQAATSLSCSTDVVITSSSNNQELLLANCGSTAVRVRIEFTADVVLSVDTVMLSHVELVNNTNLNLRISDCTNAGAFVGRPFLSINASELRLRLLVEDTVITTTSASAVYSGPVTNASIWCRECTLSFVNSRFTVNFRAAFYFADLVNSTLHVNGTRVESTQRFLSSETQQASFTVAKASHFTAIALHSAVYLATAVTAVNNLQFTLLCMSFPSWDAAGSVTVCNSSINMTANALVVGARCTLGALGGAFTNATVLLTNSSFASLTSTSTGSSNFLIYSSSFFAAAVFSGTSQATLASSRFLVAPQSSTASFIEDACVLGSNVVLRDTSVMVVRANQIHYIMSAPGYTSSSYTVTQRMYLTAAAVNAGATLIFVDNSAYVTWHTSEIVKMGFVAGTINTGSIVRFVNNTMSHLPGMSVYFNSYSGTFVAPVHIVYDFQGSNATLNPFDAAMCADVTALFCGNSFYTGATSFLQSTLLSLVTLMPLSVVESNVAVFGVSTAQLYFFWAQAANIHHGAVIRHNYFNATRVLSVNFFAFGVMSSTQATIVSGNVINAYRWEDHVGKGLLRYRAWCDEGAAVCNNTAIISGTSSLSIVFLTTPPNLVAAAIVVRDNIVNTVGANLNYKLLHYFRAFSAAKITVANNTYYGSEGAINVDLFSELEIDSNRSVLRDNVMVFQNYSAKDSLSELGSVFPSSCVISADEDFLACNNSVLVTTTSNLIVNFVRVSIRSGGVLNVTRNSAYAGNIPFLSFVLFNGGSLIGACLVTDNSLRVWKVLRLVVYFAQKLYNGQVSVHSNVFVAFSVKEVVLRTAVTSGAITALSVSRNLAFAMPTEALANAAAAAALGGEFLCPTASSSRMVVCNNTFLSIGNATTSLNSIFASLTFSIPSSAGLPEVVGNVLHTDGVEQVTATFVTVSFYSPTSRLLVVDNLVFSRRVTNTYLTLLTSFSTASGKLFVAGNYLASSGPLMSSIQPFPMQLTCPAADGSLQHSVFCNNTMAADGVVGLSSLKIVSGLSWELSSAGTEVQIVDNFVESTNVTSVTLVMFEFVSQAHKLINMSGNVATIINAPALTFTLLNSVSSRCANVNVIGNEVVINSTRSTLRRPVGYGSAACHVPAADWSLAGPGVTLVCGNVVTATNNISGPLLTSTISLAKNLQQSVGSQTFVHSNWIAISAVTTSNVVYVVQSFSHTTTSNRESSLSLDGNIVDVDRFVDVPATQQTSAEMYLCQYCSVFLIRVASNSVRLNGLRGNCLVYALLSPSTPTGSGKFNVMMSHNVFFFGETTQLAGWLTFYGIASVSSTNAAAFEADANVVTVRSESSDVALLAHISTPIASTNVSVTWNRVVVSLGYYVNLLALSNIQGNLTVANNVLEAFGTSSQIIAFQTCSSSTPMLLLSNNFTVVAAAAVLSTSAFIGLFVSSTALWNATDNVLGSVRVKYVRLHAHQYLRTVNNPWVHFAANIITVSHADSADTRIFADIDLGSKQMFPFEVVNNVVSMMSTTQTMFALIREPNANVNLSTCLIHGNSIHASDFSSADVVLVSAQHLLSAGNFFGHDNAISATLPHLSAVSIRLLHSARAGDMRSGSLWLYRNHIVVRNVTSPPSCTVAFVAAALRTTDDVEFTAINNSLVVSLADEDAARAQFVPGSFVNATAFRLGRWSSSRALNLTGTRVFSNATVDRLHVTLLAFSVRGPPLSSVRLISSNVSVAGNVSTVTLQGLDASVYAPLDAWANDNHFTVAETVQLLHLAFLRYDVAASPLSVSATANTFDVHSAASGGLIELAGGTWSVAELSDLIRNPVNTSSDGGIQDVFVSEFPRVFQNNFAYFLHGTPIVSVMSATLGTNIAITNVSLLRTDAVINMTGSNAIVTITNVTAAQCILNLTSSAGNLNASIVNSTFDTLELRGRFTATAGTAMRRSYATVAGGSSLRTVRLTDRLSMVSLRLDAVSVTHDAASAPVSVVAVAPWSVLTDVSVHANDMQLPSASLPSLVSITNASVPNSSFVIDAAVGSPSLTGPVFALTQLPPVFGDCELWLRSTALAAPLGLVAVDSVPLAGYGAASTAAVRNLRVALYNSTLDGVEGAVATLSAKCVGCNVTIAGSTVRGTASVEGETPLITVNSTSALYGTVINLDNSTFEGFNDTLSYTAPLLGLRPAALLIESACIVWNTSVWNSSAVNETYPVIPQYAVTPFERIYVGRPVSAVLPSDDCPTAYYYAPTASITLNPTASHTVSVSSTVSGSPSLLLTPSVSHQSTVTRTASASRSRSRTLTWSLSATLSTSLSLSGSSSRSKTVSASLKSPTASATPSPSRVLTPTNTSTQSRIGTRTVSAILSTSLSKSFSTTLTLSRSQTMSRSPSLSVSSTTSSSLTVTPTIPLVPTPTVTSSASAVFSLSLSRTSTPTLTMTMSKTRSRTVSASDTISTSLTSTPSLTQTIALIPTATATQTFSNTASASPSVSHSPTASNSRSATPSGSLSTSYSQTPTSSQSMTFTASMPPPVILSTAVTLRINGSNWEDVLAQGNASVIEAVKTFTAAATNVTVAFVEVTRLAIGSLIADIEIRYRADMAAPEPVLIASIVTRANLTELSQIYTAATGENVALGFAAVRLANATLVDAAPAACDRQCRIGVSIGVAFSFVIAVVAVAYALHRRCVRKHDLHENSPI